MDTDEKLTVGEIIEFCEDKISLIEDLIERAKRKPDRKLKKQIDKWNDDIKRFERIKELLINE